MQENYKSATETGRDIYKAIMETNKEEGTDTFQNSPIHLLFYERMMGDKCKGPGPVLETPPELTSMSDCKVKRKALPKLDNVAYDLELQLILENISAQFVSLEEYQQLLFILGQKPQNCS